MSIAADMGVRGELAVQSDLTRRGYTVYPALAPYANPDMLAVSKDGRVIRVEARMMKSSHDRNGKRRGVLVRHEKDRCDHWAFVSRDTFGVEYHPPLGES